MDILGPRIMVNVGTQAVSHTGPNPRDLAPLTNDAFLATFMGKPALPTTNGISRQPNNFRQPYGTQMERGSLRSKPRPSTINGESIEPDSAILSIIRGNGFDNNQQSIPHRQLQGNRRHPHRSFHQQPLISGWNDIPCSPNYRPANELNRRRRSRSGGVQQQITVVDQMAAQPHIPYAILPKRFEPKQLPNNGPQQSIRTSNNKNNIRRQYPVGAAPRRSPRKQVYYDDQWEDVDNDSWPQANARNRSNRQSNRNVHPATGFRGLRPRTNNYYDAYSYDSVHWQQQAPAYSHRRTMYPNNRYAPFDIVPSYDLNQWQGPYARSQRTLYNQKRGTSRNGPNGNGFIRDDHRANAGSKQARSGTKSTTPTHNRKQTKSSKSKGQQEKRRNSRQQKPRNQNSKSESQGASSTNVNEVKTEAESETANEDKPKEEITTSTTLIPTTNETEEKPLPPRDTENKENEGDKPVEQNS